MVEDTVTDGKRIAQLLASELTGLDEGQLDGVSVTDSNPDASPTESGTTAYTVAVEDSSFAVVSMYPDRVTVAFEQPVAWPAADGRPAVLGDDEQTLEVTTGAAVKQAVDAVRVALAAEASG